MEQGNQQDTQGTLGLPSGSTLRIEDGAGILLYVWEGSLWITEEGSRKDHMLQAGQYFGFKRSGSALVHAFQRSVVSMTSPRPDDPARRIALTRPGTDPDTATVLHQRRSSPFVEVLRRLRAGLLAPLGRPAVSGAL